MGIQKDCLPLKYEKKVELFVMKSLEILLKEGGSADN